MRWLHNLFSLFTARRPAPGAANAVQGPPAAPPRAPPAADSAQSVAIGVGARRPLLGADGQVAGFEFRIPERILSRLAVRSDPVARGAHLSALVASAGLIARAGNVGLVRLPLAWVDGVDAHAVSPRIMLALESGPAGLDGAPEPAACIGALRAAGAAVGWAAQTTLALRPDFVLVCAGELTAEQLLAQVPAWPAALRDLPVVATDLHSLADIEYALGHGIRHVCGALTNGSVPGDARDRLPMPPDVRRLAQLLSQLVSGAETAAIAEQIKSDVGLSVRLIRRLDSAAFAHVRKDGGIDQLVMLLGRNELYRWFSVLMLQYMGSRQAGSALQQVALWRARLMELLAIGRGEPQAPELFTLGLASMLGLLLQVDQQAAADLLCLGANGRQALLAHAGPWALYLDTVVAAEAGTLADSAAAAGFGGGAVVTDLSAQAWDWVQSHSIAE